MSLLRGLKIGWTVLRYGLDDIALSSLKLGPARTLAALTRRVRRFNAPRGQRIREALESLGPIFVKFGQVLSTRRDLLPADIADELAKLQDQVPPFDGDEAVRIVERAFGRPITTLYASFERTPVASASIAQVHFATLHDGREVAVKVLRPSILPVIENDLGLLRSLAGWVERIFADGKRLRPRDVVAEFDKYLHDELDLVREAANATQLRRNFEHSSLLLIPEMHWPLTTDNVLTMQRMKGAPISQTERLREAGVDIARLARDGVTIFFTQVFRDGFFHADMHPGNIFVSVEPATLGRYIALDFGIVGGLLLAPEIHRYGLILAVLVGASTIGIGALRHGRRLPLMLGAGGMALMTAAVLVGHGSAEVALTMAGVVLVAAGHIANIRH